MILIKKKSFSIALIVSIISFISLFLYNNSTSLHLQKSYVNFLEDLNGGNIVSVSNINSDTLYVELKDGTKYTTENPRKENFKELLLLSSVKTYENEVYSPGKIALGLMVFASVGYLISTSIKHYSKNSEKIKNPSHMNIENFKNISYNFSNVAGNEEAKESLKDIVEFLKFPDKFNKLGAKMPKGIILYGDPGTGKTLLAKSIAGEAGVPFYAFSGSDFVEIYVGVGANRIRSIFKKARKDGKAIIFIDEIDAIGKKRNGGNGGSDERDQTLNALLTEMSGFNEKEGIVVIAATNRLDILDSALLRPGRFDRHIEVTLPDLNAREKILSLYLKDKPLEEAFSIRELAEKTTYFSGAKLESLVNEATILACKDDAECITKNHFDAAHSIVLAGYNKLNRENHSLQDKKITAYHESGHCLISFLTLKNEKISKVTIIPTTNGAGGYTLTIGEDRLYEDKDHLIKKIMVLLGGRAAEEILLGSDNITTGASNDLKKVTEIISKMVQEFGMGKTLGLLSLSSLKLHSEEIIINECKEIINDLYEKTKNLLKNNISLLENLSNSLLEKEVLYTNDILKICS